MKTTDSKVNLSDNSLQMPEFPENSSELVNFSLPVIMFTSDFAQMCVNHALGRVPMVLALSILGNMDTKRGFIHKFKVKDKAEFFGCTEDSVYKALHILRDIGFANLKLRHGKVSGRILVKSMLPGVVLSSYEKFQERKASGDLDVDAEFEHLHGHSMPVGMLHHTQLEAHIRGGTSAGHLRLMLSCCLNVDVQRGELHEKRPCEWAELSGIHRTWASKGFAHFNELGVSQTRTDYDVIGRLPFVALANGHFRLLELAREEGREDSKDRLKEKMVALYECFGIDLKGLAHEIVENAWRLLGTEVDKLQRRARQKMKELLGREPSGSFARRRVVEGADSDRIPHRGTLPLREVLPSA